MIEPTIYSQTGLSVNHSDPLWHGLGQTYDPIRDAIQGYQHVIAADGWYKSSRIDFSATVDAIEFWWRYGPGRDILVLDEGLSTVWEGFVNSITIKIGLITVVRGSIMNIANRVACAYTPWLDLSVDPPVRGDATITTFAEDADSQTLYGIQEQIIAGGTLIDDDTTIDGIGTPPTTNEAEEARDNYLAQYKHLDTDQELTLGSSSEGIITLDCLGYNEWLKSYTYLNNGTGQVQFPTKIEAVLGADPNGIFSTNYHLISNSAAYLGASNVNESDYRTAYTIIQEIVKMGDNNDNRVVFGIGRKREAYYKAIPTEVEYVIEVLGGNQMVYEQSRLVMPWKVVPGKWMRYSDVQVGKLDEGEPKPDMRNEFIESVTYTAPFGLTLPGGKIGTLAQAFAKKGISI